MYLGLYWRIPNMSQTANSMLYLSSICFEGTPEASLWLYQQREERFAFVIYQSHLCIGISGSKNWRSAKRLVQNQNLMEERARARNLISELFSH
jgi:hypothetical protein